MNIQGKSVLITGASSGIGAALARAVADAGGRPLLLARREAELRQVADSLGPGADARVYPVDLSDPKAVDDVADRITAEVGTPDVLVNNAGAGRWKFVDETTPEEAIQMMAVPYFAAFCITHAFLPKMIRRGSGHIVNVSSVASHIVWPGATAYTAARWAVRGFTEALRADLKGTGVGITLLECGVVKTPYWDHNPGSRERVPKMGKLVPELTPEQVASAIIRGIEHNRHYVVIPFMMRVTILQHAVAPRMVQWLMTATGYRRPGP
ncbi:MAG TPA: SDR family NAD(P)-dependent oxidoreductase [Gemmatimonadales bacterium]|nr:SDR family NAD(P)-dependent oxidoreductase [Gemmatimonadales bacterium]